MTLAILGIGTALPHHILSQRNATQQAEVYCCSSHKQKKVIANLYRRTNIQLRRTVLADDGSGQASWSYFYPPPSSTDDTGPTTARRMSRYAGEATPLAAAAARAALEEADLPASAITHLITVSCTGFFAPGIDIGLIDALSLSPAVRRCHIGFMGCHGALNGLSVALSLCALDPQVRVLLCATELCSLHFQYGWKSDGILANSLFADGAAAIVAGDGAAASHQDWHLIASGSFLIPDTRQAMTWRIGDHGFVMTMSSSVPALIEQHLPAWLLPWLSQQGLHVKDVQSWVVHPGGPRILDAVASCLNLPGDALDESRDVLSQCGNMSSPTVLFILDRLHRRNAGRPCVILGFGPGLAIEAALIN